MEEPSRPGRLASQDAEWHVALTVPASKDCRIATVSNNKHGKLQIRELYCEPEFKGSNNGLGIA